MLDEHLGYVSDSIRLEYLKAAIVKVVHRGDRIADVGCGSGVLGLLCLQADAGFVYAIDSSAMIEIARESLHRAGFGRKVFCIQSQSEKVVLPEQVDLVICDHVGYFGFDYGIIKFIEDARRRFLKPGGTLIPKQIKLYLAPVESHKCQVMAGRWRAQNVPTEFHWLHSHSVNTKHVVTLEPKELLGLPVELGGISFSDDNPDFFSWEAELCIARNGVMHGLGGWFDCELAKDVWMTNSPLADRAINRPQVFLPIGEAVEVKAGDKVRTKVMARPGDSLIAWEVELQSNGRKFNHSTWNSKLLPAQAFLKRKPAHVLNLNRQGRARMIVLGFCDGEKTIGQIEEAVLRQHPDLFPTKDEIIRFIAQVFSKDAE